MRYGGARAEPARRRVISRAAALRPRQLGRQLTIYVAGYTSAYLPVIEQARVQLFGQRKAAGTLIGVARLARPEFLIDLDAIAVK
jgi:enamine deaminase RidA (YjgF/YER057c/UK114 family)